MFKDVDALREQIRAFGLKRLEDKIIRLAKPAIFMHRTAASQDELATGDSRLGGLPDLPANFQWPHYGKKPLTFIGQFKLSEIAPHDADSILPEQGILYFFYEADETPWGFSGEEAGWQIFYLENENTPLIRTEHPAYPGEFRTINSLPAHRIEYQSCITLPVIFGREKSEFDIEFQRTSGQIVDEDTSDRDEHSAYFKMTFTGGTYHYWLGYPRRWQSFVEYDVVIESQQIKPRKNPQTGLFEYTDEQLSYVRAETNKWQFLFQIDTDKKLDVIWGDYGTLYVCIPKASQVERRFEDCWTIMQCS